MLDVERIPRRYWALIGAVAGFLLALGGTVAPQQHVRTLGQAQFEDEIVGLAFPGQPLLIDIVIRPTGQGHQVTGRRLTRRPDGWYAAAFTMRAAVPYVPLRAASGDPPPPNIMTYLDQLSRQHAHIRYSYRVLGSTPLRLSVYSLIGALVMGIGWPAAMRVLVGAGLGRKPAQVGEGEGDALQPVAASDQPPPPPAAGAGPAEPVPPDEHAQPKRYGGVYYPTEAHAQDESSEAAVAAQPSNDDRPKAPR